MKKLRVAIIGYGRSGQQIHGAFFASDKNEKYEVAIVVDELEVRREQAKARHNCEVFADYHEILDRKDIDLVVNATYSHFHAPVAIDFLNHGFNVVSEKPFAVHADDCQKMIRTVLPPHSRNSRLRRSRPHRRDQNPVLRLCTPLGLAVFAELGRRLSAQHRPASV